MDIKTLQYYSKNSKTIAETYNSCEGGISLYFKEAFTTSMKILDIGCGSGRDLRILHEMGFQADGVDPCEEFINFVNSQITRYGSKVFVDYLPELATIHDNSYDGILCSAVLMHLPKEELFDAIFAIRRILKEKGRLLLSIPQPDTTIDPNTHRDINGRLFNGIIPEELQLMLERIGFRLLTRWDSDDSLNRDHRKWTTMLYELKSI